MACSSGGGSPNSPSPSPPGTGNPAASACRTVAAISHSVQTFVTGVTVTSDTNCAHNTGTNDVVCHSNFVDSVGGPGEVTQTSRFASRSDIVDEGAANPPLSRSLGTTTVVSSGGFGITTTATNTYDDQKRLRSTAIAADLPQLASTTTFSAWDNAGRPTAGMTSGAITFPVVYTYDNIMRTVIRNMGPNICTATHDANGIMIKEQCTGTTPSTTIVTVSATAGICK
jgi:hypothetical protein